MDRMENENRRAELEFKKKLMELNEGIRDDLDTVQRNIEIATGHVVPHERKKRNIMISTPESVRLREEAAARCTAKIKKRKLKNQARKARAEHHVRCSLEPGKKA